MSDTTGEGYDTDRFSRDIEAIRTRLKQTSAMSSASLDTLAERQREAHAKTSLTIVYADDDDRYRHLLRALLRAYPRFRVVGEAADGQQAIALAIAQRPDVVLLDVEMPGVNGVDAAEAIRRALPDTRILLHTGDAGSARIEQATAIGFEIVDKLDINETLDRVALELDALPRLQ